MPTEVTDLESRLRRHYASMSTYQTPTIAGSSNWKGRVGLVAVGLGVIAVGLVGWSRMGEQNPVTVTASEEGGTSETDGSTTSMAEENESDTEVSDPATVTRDLEDVPLIDANYFAERVDGDYPALIDGPAVIDDPRGLSLEDAITWAKESGFKWIQWQSAIYDGTQFQEDMLTPYRITLIDHNGIVESAEVG